MQFISVLCITVAHCRPRVHALLSWPSLAFDSMRQELIVPALGPPEFQTWVCRDTQPLPTLPVPWPPLQGKSCFLSSTTTAPKLPEVDSTPREAIIGDMRLSLASSQPFPSFLCSQDLCPPWLHSHTFFSKSKVSPDLCFLNLLYPCNSPHLQANL